MRKRSVMIAGAAAISSARVRRPVLGSLASKGVTTGGVLTLGTDEARRGDPLAVLIFASVAGARKDRRLPVLVGHPAVVLTAAALAAALPQTQDSTLGLARTSVPGFGPALL